MNLSLLLEDKSLSYHIEERLCEFKKLGEEGQTVFDFSPYVNISYKADLFSELCFCILTANFSAEKGILIQADIGIDGFKKFNKRRLLKILKDHGHRFPEQRVERILKARKKADRVLKLIQDINEPHELRRLLSHPKSEFKIEGFGYKEASHFLRNIGYDNIAILDRHVVRFLKENKYIKDFKTLTPKIYEEVEKIVLEMAEKLRIKPSALDLYIFYSATGKVLK